MKSCVINFADGVFIKGQDRLRRSLKDVGFTGDLLFFDRLLPGWPAHEKVPMGFKVYAFEEAFKKGYDSVFWLDAACIAIRPLEPIFKTMQEKGIFSFSRFNAPVGEWSSDYTLKEFGITREEAFHIPELVNCAIGVNIKHPTGKVFFDEWKIRVRDGISFLGLPEPYGYKDTINNDRGLLSGDPRVQGHRWDQTTASLILNRLGVKPTKRILFDLVCEAKKGKAYSNYIPIDTIVVQNRDIKNDKYLYDLKQYTEPWRTRSIPYMCKTVFKSFVRYAKDFIKWHLVYRKRYNY